MYVNTHTHTNNNNNNWRRGFCPSKAGRISKCDVIVFSLRDLENPRALIRMWQRRLEFISSLGHTESIATHRVLASKRYLELGCESYTPGKWQNTHTELGVGTGSTPGRPWEQRQRLEQSPRKFGLICETDIVICCWEENELLQPFKKHCGR